MFLRRSVAVCLFFVAEVILGNFAIAHEIRPAYLQLTEVSDDETKYHILWKQPVVQNRRLPVDPVFSNALRNIWPVHQIFNGLVQLDDSLKIKPDIAKYWNISEHYGRRRRGIVGLFWG